jgi:iron complex outermembrane receptor protein
MFNETKVASALRTAFGGGLAGIALMTTSAVAQVAPQDDVQRGERVEVTGSSIKRIDAESALPVQVLTRQDIDRLAPQNVEDLLRTVTASSGVGGTQLSTGATAATSGISSISLRGLGAQRTLVLVNGRRVAPFGGIPGGGGVAAVDVNSIPLAAIERVEILKDGASAIYGSDAVAGVVNFILRSDYQGVLAEASYGQTTHSATGRSYQSDVLLGFGDLRRDRFNAMLTASYNKEDAIYGRDRYFANTVVNNGEGQDTTSGNTYPANIVAGNGAGRNFLAPAFAGQFPTFGLRDCSPGVPRSPTLLAPNTPVATDCRYDPGNEVALIPQSTRTAVGFQGRFAITPTLNVYTELNGSRNIIKTLIQATPISDQFPLTATNSYIPQLAALINTNRAALTSAYGSAFVDSLLTQTTFLLPTTSPYYPTAFAAANGLAGSPIDIRYRSNESGGRALRDENTGSRYLAGLNGTAAGWDFDGGLMFAESRVKESLLDGYPQYSRILPLLNSGVVNPFGPSTPDVLARIKAANYQGEAFRSKQNFEQFDAHASRELYPLPAGPLSLAVGGQLRHEHYDFRASKAAQSGDLSGYGGNFLDIDAQRNTEAAFAEINVPIVKGLEADAAVRYDKYNGVANTTNPKASLRWQPMKELLLRAAIGTGFRAPALDELFAPVTIGASPNGLSDPVRCPVTGSSNDCNTQFTVRNGGNTGLKPEKSVSASAGFQLEPTDNVHLGADYFDTRLRNQIVIGGVGAAAVLSDLAQFGNLVTRAPSQGGLPGQITSINQQNLNLNKVHVDGIDFDARLRLPLAAFGRLTVGINATYFLRYDFGNSDGSYTGVISDANSGIGGVSGVIARYRHIAQATWDYGPWSTTLTDNYQTSYKDFDSNVTGQSRTVGAYETFDVQASYSGIKGVTISVGIRNFMDKDPPYSNTGGQFQGGYDATYADPRGRFLYAKLAYRFM